MPGDDGRARAIVIATIAKPRREPEIVAVVANRTRRGSSPKSVTGVQPDKARIVPVSPTRRNETIKSAKRNLARYA